MSDESERPENSGDDEARPALKDRARDDMRTRLRRVRLTALPIVQAALGAAVAWWVATSPLVGHDRPFFAPIAAVITLSGGLGQRLPRVIQLVGGVALGVLVGDLLIFWIGTGGLQIAVVVAMAMTVAVLVGGGAIIVTQAGASAVLVATLIPPTAGEVVNLDRFIDALVGGGIGLGVSVLLLPLNPVSAARKQIEPLLNTLAELLENSATALADQDRPAASRNLARARETQAAVDSMHDALEGANEVAKIAPVRWRKRGHLADYLDAAEPLDHLCRNIRVLCRHAIGLLRRGEPVPPVLPQSLRALAGALRLLRLDLDSGAEHDESRTSAVAAAKMATEALEQTGGFGGQIVIAQVRSLAVDVLHATGIGRDEAQQMLPDLPQGPVRYS